MILLSLIDDGESSGVNLRGHIYIYIYIFSFYEPIRYNTIIFCLLICSYIFRLYLFGQIVVVGHGPSRTWVCGGSAVHASRHWPMLWFGSMFVFGAMFLFGKIFVIGHMFVVR